MAELTAQQRQDIWAALDEMARQHRAFPDANWVLPDGDLKEIEELATKFQPASLVDNQGYLFAEQMPDLGSSRSDSAAYEASLAERRKDAVRQIFQTEGAAGIDRLVDSAKESFTVGCAVADSGIEIPQDQILQHLDSSEQHRATYALGYARQRSNRDGFDWVQPTLSQLGGKPLAQARVLRVTPIYPDVWHRATAAGPEVEAAYWAEFLPIGLGQNFEWINEAAEKLLQYDRPGAAVDLLALYSRNDPMPRKELVADALEALIESASEQQQRVSPYELQQLLDLLRQAGFDEDRLARLEWRMIPGLGYGVPAPTLERQLARNPAFFVQILSMCFKRKDGTTEEQPTPEVARNAFHLLNDWQVVPGSIERGGEVDDANLREWLDQTVALLRDADRLDIGSLYIGHVFAHAKGDPDGTWPTKPVRDAIERLSSDEIDQGFGSQIYNNRGVTSRSLTAGGQQERDLAERFEQWESMIRDQWPRTAAVLRSVAQGYRAQGQAEDEEAERFKKGLDPY